MLKVALRIFHFHFAYGFFTRTLAYRIDSLVRVSRRDGKNHFGKITVVPQALYALSGLHLCWRKELDFAQHSGKYAAFPHSTFSMFVSFSASFSTISDLFTLFSKSFSSFLHSTCSLSVSHLYLALEESYLPLGLQFQATRLLWKQPYSENNCTGLAPSLARLSILLSCFQYLGCPDYNSEVRWTNDSNFELFPVQSPLLRESLLISFPPLNNMLKSSGSSCLCSGANKDFISQKLTLLWLLLRA